jgi:hypothetical protein
MMKLLEVEFISNQRLPFVTGGPHLTAQVGKIESSAGWLLDLDDTGYVVVRKEGSEDATMYSPAVVKRIRVAPPEPAKKK